MVYGGIYRNIKSTLPNISRYNFTFALIVMIRVIVMTSSIHLVSTDLAFLPPFLPEKTWGTTPPGPGILLLTPHLIPIHIELLSLIPGSKVNGIKREHTF